MVKMKGTGLDDERAVAIMVWEILQKYGIREANASMPICEPTLHGETYKNQEQLLKSDSHAQK